MSDINNKERILKVREIFLNETDEEHELSFEEIINRLKLEYGPDYEVGLRAIKDDIETLMNNKETYLIINNDKYGKKLYSKQNRKFDIYELRILIDAILSARFITKDDSKVLINKIKSLTSEELSKKLDRDLLHIDDYIVNEDKSFKYYLNDIHAAIQEGKNVKFKYVRYDINIKMCESNNGDYYEVEPYGLVWNNGFYYLVGFNLKKQTIINYRVDRIRELENTKNKSINKRNFNLSVHVNNCFNMYPGVVNFMKIKFENHLINAIIDRFGKDVKIEKAGDDNHFYLFTEAAINKGLVRWILNWGSDAEVIHPKSLVNMVKEELEKMNLIYNK